MRMRLGDRRCSSQCSTGQRGQIEESHRCYGAGSATGAQGARLAAARLAAGEARQRVWPLALTPAHDCTRLVTDDPVRSLSVCLLYVSTASGIRLASLSSPLHECLLPLRGSLPHNGGAGGCCRREARMQKQSRSWHTCRSCRRSGMVRERWLRGARTHDANNHDVSIRHRRWLSSRSSADATAGVCCARAH